MSPPKSLAAYAQFETHFEAALEAPAGIGILLETAGQAQNFIQQANYYRTLLRKLSAEVHPEDSPEYGKSIYDSLAISRDPHDQRRVLIKPRRPDSSPRSRGLKILEIQALPKEGDG
jgi:prolyl oligopeptidase PreP (S9A serine peptidase family)